MFISLQHLLLPRGIWIGVNRFCVSWTQVSNNNHQLWSKFKHTQSKRQLTINYQHLSEESKVFFVLVSLLFRLPPCSCSAFIVPALLFLVYSKGRSLRAILMPFLSLHIRYLESITRLHLCRSSVTQNKDLSVSDQLTSEMNQRIL